MQRVGPEGGDREAKLHDLGVQPTSPKSNFRCAADGEHVLTGARAGNWRACTCSPLTAALRSTRRCTVPLVRPPAPPPSATRSQPFFSAAPAFSRRLCALLVATRWLRGGLEGGLEPHDGDFGGFGSAAARQLSLGSSGGPRALSGGFAGCAGPANRACSALRGLRKKCAHVSGRCGAFLYA